MHSSTTLAVILLAASAASPAIAAPLNAKQARELDPDFIKAVKAQLDLEKGHGPIQIDAREPSVVDLLKPLGTGLLGGGAVAALDHFFKGGDSSKRESTFVKNLKAQLALEQGHGPVQFNPLTARESTLVKELKAQLAFEQGQGPAVPINPSAIAAREPSVVDLLKPLGTGLLGGGAVAALDHFFKGGSASSRAFEFTAANGFDHGPERITPDELEALARRSVVGSLLGATEDSLGTVLKTSAAGGLASGAVAAAGGALEHLFGDKGSSSKRASAEVEESLAHIIQGFGGGNGREPTPRSVVGSLLGATEDSLGTVLKTSAAGGLASGAVAAAGGALEHLFGNKDSSSRRELEERLNLGPIEKGLIGTVTSLGVSGAASDLLGKVFGNKDSKRELEERLNLGPIEKGLIGTVTSLGVSGAASDLLGKVFGNKDSRDVTPEQALAAIILSGRSFNELD